MKKKWNQIIHILVKTDVLNGIISAVIIVCILFCRKQKEVDYSVLYSLAIVLILTTVGHFISVVVNNWIEDGIKLTNDYDKLCKSYKNKKQEYTNSKDNKKDKKNDESGNKVIFPILNEGNLLDLNIHIDDKPENMYKLPEFAQEHYDELIKAHSSSSVYNQLNIRIKNWYLNDGVFNIETERTTYYDSLVTNRAMDYHLESGLSIRDKLCYGPFLPALGESNLSNHIGFNGFLETSDNYIPIIKRNKDLSIGKRVWGLSVEGSIKVCELVSSETEKLTVSALIKGIRAEYHKELGIPKNNDDLKEILKKEKSKKIKKFIESLIEKGVTLEPKHNPVNQNPVHGICTAYRNIVEGGKPQFFTYYKTSLTKNELEIFFKENARKNSKNLFVDGKRIGWLKAEDICGDKGFLVYNNKIICKSKIRKTKIRKFKMVPSTSVCFTFAIESGLFNSEE